MSDLSAPSPVLFDVTDGVATIVINRPEQRNAVNRAVSEAIASCLDELDRRDDASVGILTGAGGTFCAGMDLKAFLKGEVASLPERGFGGLTLRPPKKPLIAAVEGWALAGGCELVLACDLVVAARGSQFGLPEVKRGLVASAGGLIRLPRLVARGVALEILLTGKPLSAVDAKTIGLVNRLCDDGAALDEARRLGAEIVANAPLALEVVKEFIDASAAWSIEEAFERQASFTDRVFSSEDAREGAAAFVEKRAPRWTGR